MAGHSAIFGNRFSLVQGAKASTSRASYDLSNLPMHTEDSYWATINCLSATSSKQQRARITKETGVSHLPLCAASPAFIHPTFFPLDLFHLFYENDVAFIWDLWTKARQFGEAVANAMKTLPPAFCGPYKVYEWMALLHWYVLPIGMELGFNPLVLENFSQLVSAIEFTMSIKEHMESEIMSLHLIIQKFLTGFKSLYINGNPELISRARLCIFQLTHVPIHIKWNGSIRIGSQATVERNIGEKSPFANLANIITGKELIRILSLYYPSLSVEDADYHSHLKIRITRKEEGESALIHELQALEDYSETNVGNTEMHVDAERWGKVRLANGHLLRSRRRDQGTPATRLYRWFEGYIEDNIWRALAFYKLTVDGVLWRNVIVYHRLAEMKQTLGQLRGSWDRKTVRTLEISAIIDIVGIWEPKNESERVYILRKHPGIALLNTEELGKSPEEDTDEEEGMENDESAPEYT
ncbi:hypothetical protein CPB84DRAFT_1838325 [Gymnopilus junonius]|uniref:Uncharacterized protein n=1 Tax=Gymnopilus junonius TaxID=109634 RepID=A0A9P5NDF4_GYMJU|nr:hypothetical protein CPB84DRAFT_1838325 [Gymnopilus junonius]